MSAFSVSRRPFRRRLFASAALALLIPLSAHAEGDGAEAPAAATAKSKAPAVSEVVVTAASHVNLLGVADTASQGSITQEELQLRPVYRVGQLLETTPGLVVTVHSGEGKA